MPNPVLALQLFSTAVAVKSVIDQKNANKEREAINCMGLFIVHHLHSWLIPNSPALRIKVLSA
jgi:hypothetical protein